MKDKQLQIAGFSEYESQTGQNNENETQFERQIRNNTTNEIESNEDRDILDTESDQNQTYNQYREQTLEYEETESINSESETRIANSPQRVQNPYRQSKIPAIRARRERPVKPRHGPLFNMKAKNEHSIN